MRPVLKGKPGTALLLAGLLVVSVLTVLAFAGQTPPSGAPPPGGQPGGGNDQGNNNTSNNLGGRLVARFVLEQPSGLVTPVRGISVQIDSNTTSGTTKPKSLHLQTNQNGYAFAQLVPGPYILSATQQGWSLIGSFEVSEGRTTDFNATVKGVSIPVTAYDIQDPDSSSMLGPWATMSVNLPLGVTLAYNQTAYFETQAPPGGFVSYFGFGASPVSGLPYYVNIRNGTTTFPPNNASVTGGPSTSAALVVGVYRYASGQWATLRPLGTMAISQFSQTSLLVYQATYQTSVETVTPAG